MSSEVTLGVYLRGTVRQWRRVGDIRVALGDAGVERDLDGSERSAPGLPGHGVGDVVPGEPPP
jgi:hypothetical protein